MDEQGRNLEVFRKDISFYNFSNIEESRLRTRKDGISVGIIMQLATPDTGVALVLN